MILILSTEDDISTNKVIDWLVYFNVPFIRVNDSSKIELCEIDLNNNLESWNLKITEIDKEEIIEIDSRELKGFWYRRGLFQFEDPINLKGSFNHIIELMVNRLHNYLRREKSNIVDFIYLALRNIKHLGYFHDNETIKLCNLRIAKDSGLNIPRTMITSIRNKVLAFKEEVGKCITKGINNNGFFVPNIVEFSSLTQLLEDSDIHKLSETFAPSIIQEYIEKLFELRIFYIEGKCYTAAIYSQSDEMTKVDFRNYNDERPNRLVPFKLPADIETKIDVFMQTVKMKTGSIDMILSTKFEYVFLEVNPIGQFDWISKKCNYQLERVIANYYRN